MTEPTILDRDLEEYQIESLLDGDTAGVRIDDSTIVRLTLRGSNDA